MVQWDGWRRCGLAMMLALVLTAIAGLIGTEPALAQGRVFYVSRAGNNADGLSWATAWNELDRINWSIIGPGDTILIDGGPTACPSLGPGYDCGMVYNSTLSIGASGASDAPIVLRLADESGRNGTVVIDGGITQWSRCVEYAPEPTPPSSPNGAGTRETGIKVNGAQWVVIDGTKWGGIEIRNHTRYGLSFGDGQYVTARYLKVHHNTHPTDSTNNAVGVTQSYLSQFITLAHSEIFRNGQDAIRGAGDFFVVEGNYIHDQYCNHPDGIQSFVPTSGDSIPDDAGQVRGLMVRGNIFERIGMQAIFLGENATHNSWNVDVVIHDNLFLDGDYMIKSKHGQSTNWSIFNNTFVGTDEFAVEWCCARPGAQGPMRLENNVFAQAAQGRGAFYLPTSNGGTAFYGNCLHRTGTISGDVVDSGSIYADPAFVEAGAGNFALAGGSPCAGKGSRITSVSQLLSLNGVIPGP